MRLSELLQGVEGRLIGAADIEISAICADTRKPCQGGLFVCIQGERTDGHTLIKTAERKGAVAFVTERETDTDKPQYIVSNTRLALALLAAVFYGNPARAMTVVGVTGTNGKTTTAHMLASIWQAADKKTGIIGTLGASYGGKHTDFGLTTPDPIELHAVLADMKKSGVERVAMEVSAHALHYQKTAGIEFAACIFTNLSQDHLDFFGDMEGYAAAKRKLFLPSCCKIAVLNGDEALGREIGKGRTENEGENTENGSSDTLYYGLDTPCDAFAVTTSECLHYTDCTVNINDNLYPVRLSAFGKHNLYNALAAATCAYALGDGAGISLGLRHSFVRGRMERVQGLPKDVFAFVDFAHTPDGLAHALSALKGFCKGKLLCVFGCGGNRDAEKRPLMGETAAKYADFTVITSDNPRYEDPLDIIGDIERGFRACSCNYVIVPDRRTAIAYAAERLKTGDILLVAGKGAETYQEVMGIKYPFDDYTVLEGLLCHRFGGRSEH